MWSLKNVLHRKWGIFDDKWVYYGSDNQDNRGQDYSSEAFVYTDDAATVSRFSKRSSRRT